MDLMSLIDGLYAAIGGWMWTHGARILLIIVVALLADLLVRAALSKKQFSAVLDNLPGAKYKTIISQEQEKRAQTIFKALKDTLSFVILTITGVTILPEFGVNVAPILAGLGLAGLAVGMAAKDILSDFIAGFFIIIEGEYNIGDEIEIAGAAGRVLDMSLRRTVLRDANGSTHIVPNREIKLIKRFAGGTNNGRKK